MTKPIRSEPRHSSANWGSAVSTGVEELIAVKTIAVLLRKSDCEFEIVVNDLFDGNSHGASIGEQDSERWFVFVEFVFGNSGMVDQILNTKPSDHFSLRYS
jgi:hypothetical protein